MISFTGSTEAGVRVGEAAAQTVTRVCLELGGKSANIVLSDADLEKAARWNIERGFFNTGQSCHSPSRLLVHESHVEGILPFLVDEIGRIRVGDPRDPGTTQGPLVNAAQFEWLAEPHPDRSGRGCPDGLWWAGRIKGFDSGYFSKPTVLADVTPDMTLAEEIFGPVFPVIPYATEDEALGIANDSSFGLGGYVFSADRKNGYEFACGLRAGRISYNGAATNSVTPMGGYKQSGIGRSMGGWAWRNISKSSRSTASKRSPPPCRPSPDRRKLWSSTSWSKSQGSQQSTRSTTRPAASGSTGCSSPSRHTPRTTATSRPPRPGRRPARRARHPVGPEVPRLPDPEPHDRHLPDDR